MEKRAGASVDVNWRDQMKVLQEEMSSLKKKAGADLDYHRGFSAATNYHYRCQYLDSQRPRIQLDNGTFGNVEAMVLDDGRISIHSGFSNMSQQNAIELGKWLVSVCEVIE